MEEREILSKSRGLVRNRKRDLEALLGFVKVNQATYRVGGHVPTAEDLEEWVLRVAGSGQ